MTRPRKFPARRPPAASDPAWFEIRGAATDRAEVFIYDQIGESFWGDGTSAKSFAEALKGITASQIDLHLNSPGGSVTDGQAIYNALQRHPATITTYIDGLAASIASVIALAADHVVMADNALYMIHNPYMVAMGDANEMRAKADLLDKVRDLMANTYQDKSGMDRGDLLAAMDAETWYTAQEAYDAGFVDEVGTEQAVAASFDLDTLGYRNYPGPAAGGPVTTPTPGVPAAPPEKEHDMTPDEITALVTATFDARDAVTAAVPSTPAYVPTAKVQDAFPYRPGVQASFFGDMVKAQRDPDAARRFSQAESMLTAAADTTTNIAEIIPTTYRPDLFVAQLTTPRIVIDSFSRGTLDGPNPLRIPKFNTATGMSADHVEGTNPTTGNLDTAEQVLTPKAVSGVYQATREMIEGSTPAVDQIIMDAIRQEYASETEAYAVTTFLTGATAGTVVDISNGVTLQILQRMITFQANRKQAPDVFLAGTTLFPELVIQVDSTGRPLNPYLGAANAPGSIAGKALAVNVGGMATPFAQSLTDGLLGLSTDAVTLESAHRFWRWEEKSGPATIEIAHFGYIVCAVTRAVGLLKFATQA